jgi:pimeloyl-ACP methyl ester carboxylesterase
MSTFLDAYDAVLARWPAADTRDVPTPFGTTRVTSVGAADAPPLVLLPGGGATAMVWLRTAPALARTHRVHAVDLVGEPGRSVPAGRRVRTAGDLCAWLDALLDGLGVTATALGGHSYGGWIALRYALHAGGRIPTLALIDPSVCFAGYRPAYLARALPLLLRPTPARVAALHDWETRGAAVDPGWRRLRDLTASVPAARPVRVRRPTPDELRRLTARTLVVLAADSRVHDSRAVAGSVARLLPAARITILPGASHHSLPQVPAEPLVAALTDFLAEPARG